MLKLKNIVGFILVGLGFWILASFFLYLNLFANNHPDCGFQPEPRTWYNRNIEKTTPSSQFGPDFYPEYIYDGLSWRCPEKQLAFVDLFAAGTTLLIAGVIAFKKK